MFISCYEIAGRLNWKAALSAAIALPTGTVVTAAVLAIGRVGGMISLVWKGDEPPIPPFIHPSFRFCSWEWCG